jgi:outer membrane protein assembly factor BamD
MIYPSRPMRRLSTSLLLLLAACATSRAGDGKSAKGPEEDFKAGEKELESKNWIEAQKLFETIKTRFPFSRYAALAELHLADLKYEQDRLVEAADAYQQFVKLHPTHEQVDYAGYRVGLCRWKNSPSEFLLFPASFEKDQTEVKAAVKAYEEFLKAYPSSKHVPDARKELAEARDRLAEHEWYVARFYQKRGRWPGVALRLESLIKDYPGTSHETEALLLLANAYLEMKERFRAQQTLQQLIVKHPQDPRRAEAEKLLAATR